MILFVPIPFKEGLKLALKGEAEGGTWILDARLTNPNAPNGAAIAWLGACVGSLIRPIGGMLADKFGGAKMTMIAIAMCEFFIIISFFSLRQRIVPSKILSRVIVVSRTLSYVSAPFSATVSGWILDYTKDFSKLIFVSIGAYILAILFSFRSLFFYKSPEKAAAVKRGKAQPAAAS